MATPALAQIPSTAFTDLDLQLLKKSEQAIRNGLILRDWCEALPDGPGLFPLDLGKKFDLPNRAQGYFGEFELNGKVASIMGCRQHVEFAHLDSPDAGQLLEDFVLGEFLSLAHWMRLDKYPGGFTVTGSLYQKPDGTYGQFATPETLGCIDWRKLGPLDSDSTFRWVLLTALIHDFVMDIGPFEKRFNEAACVVATPEFRRVVKNPANGVKLRVQIGYPFVDYAPIKNVFGFGPGKFGIAIKLYSFELLDSGRIQVTMEFAAAPRCAKVFDFGPNIPDPIYGGADFLGRMSFGIFDSVPVHTRMDKQMLAQHCRVHQSLMDGTKNVWDTWLAKKVK